MEDEGGIYGGRQGRREERGKGIWSLGGGIEVETFIERGRMIRREEDVERERGRMSRWLGGGRSGPRRKTGMWRAEGGWGR